MTNDTLHNLIQTGKVWIEGSTYVGRAADGTEVDLGAVGFESALERYILSHPEPTDW